MKQKLAFMAVLSFNRPVFILDEPFNSLDIETVDLIKNILGQLKQKGKLIIVTSHILESLTSLCDEIHCLEDGFFQKSYEKDSFDRIDKEIFSLLRDKNQSKITELIQAK